MLWVTILRQRCVVLRGKMHERRRRHLWGSNRARGLWGGKGKKEGAMFVTCIVEERGDEGEVLVVPALCFLSVFPSCFHAMRPNIFATS